MSVAVIPMNLGIVAPKRIGTSSIQNVTGTISDLATYTREGQLKYSGTSFRE